VLLRDERYRDVVDVHLIFLDEVQQEIQRSLELLEAHREGVDVRLEVGLRIHLQTPIPYLYEILIASLTRSIVSPATFRARRAPSPTVSCNRSGRPITAARRSRIGARYAFNALASLVLTSTSPTLPAR